jgi:hypothetical protein
MSNRELPLGYGRELAWAASLGRQGSIGLGVIWGMPAVIAFAFQAFWRRDDAAAWIGLYEPQRYAALPARCVPAPMASPNAAQGPSKVPMFSLLD